MATKRVINEEEEQKSTIKLYGYVILGLVILLAFQNVKYNELKHDYESLQEEYEYCMEKLNG